VLLRRLTHVPPRREAAETTLPAQLSRVLCADLDVCVGHLPAFERRDDLANLEQRKMIGKDQVSSDEVPVAVVF